MRKPRSTIRRRLCAAALAGLAVAAGVTGCGGGADRTKANLRFLNASGYTALDLVVDNVVRASATAQGSASGYQEVEPDQPDTRIRRAGSSSTLLTLTPAMSRKQHYTLVAWGREGQLRTVLLEENNAAADSGKAKLRVLNASSDAGSLDIYLTAESDALTDAVALVSAAKVGETGAFSSVTAGASWRLRVTGAGARDDLRLDLRGISLPSGSVQTLILTPATGGVLVDAVMVGQQDAVTARAVEHARVRVAAALPLGESVSVTADAQALAGGVASPSVSEYQWVPAGSRQVVVSAGAAALPTSAMVLTAGAEYTALVHAGAGTPAVAWIREDNRLPATAGKAGLRLVNGRASSTEPLYLTAAALPVAANVLPGTGSAITEVPAGEQTLALTVAGQAQPLYSEKQTLVAGKLYTVFLLGGPAPQVVFRNDR